MQKKALITGISGQDGSYLAELLVSKGYEVHGTILPSEQVDAPRSLWRLESIIKNVHLYPGMLESHTDLVDILTQTKPDECYHLAAQSYVSYSFEAESSTLNTNIIGTHSLISSIKDICPNCKVFFACSSEIFGVANETPQDENSPINPRSVYGISKAAGFYMIKNHRRSGDLFACNGIMYNHESPRRGIQFVTQKIAHGAALIALGMAHELKLGNLDAIRDWGFAGDYVQAMWQMMQLEKPDDFIVATGEGHTVRQFCEIAFRMFNLDYQKYIVVDPYLVRPTELTPLIGNPTKAKKVLNWNSRVNFDELVSMMTLAEYNRIQKEQTSIN